ncbi:mycofactocin [Mycobacterium fragae]|uniref:Mycofactocin n=1 Tax=Mycobacterium fragae TaxID=1260918 RepID=A0A1X1UT53_9MYCO|nr:mycofactocin [Mycobacterium fragae]
MPYSVEDSDQLDATCRAPITRGNVMEPNQQSDTETELVTETLVEEVSIDGMCGVY